MRTKAKLFGEMIVLLAEMGNHERLSKIYKQTDAYRLLTEAGLQEEEIQELLEIKDSPHS